MKAIFQTKLILFFSIFLTKVSFGMHELPSDLVRNIGDFLNGEEYGDLSGVDHQTRSYLPPRKMTITPQLIHQFRNESPDHSFWKTAKASQALVLDLGISDDNSNFILSEAESKLLLNALNSNKSQFIVRSKGRWGNVILFPNHPKEKIKIKTVTIDIRRRVNSIDIFSAISPIEELNVNVLQGSYSKQLLDAVPFLDDSNLKSLRKISLPCGNLLPFADRLSSQSSDLSLALRCVLPREFKVPPIQHRFWNKLSLKLTFEYLGELAQDDFNAVQSFFDQIAFKSELKQIEFNFNYSEQFRRILGMLLNTIEQAPDLRNRVTFGKEFDFSIRTLLQLHILAGAKADIKSWFFHQFFSNFLKYPNQFTGHLLGHENLNFTNLSQKAIHSYLAALAVTMSNDMERNEWIIARGLNNILIRSILDDADFSSELRQLMVTQIALRTIAKLEDEPSQDFRFRDDALQASEKSLEFVRENWNQLAYKNQWHTVAVYLFDLNAFNRKNCKSKYKILTELSVQLLSKLGSENIKLSERVFVRVDRWMNFISSYDSEIQNNICRLLGNYISSWSRRSIEKYLLVDALKFKDFAKLFNALNQSEKLEITKHPKFGEFVVRPDDQNPDIDALTFYFQYLKGKLRERPFSEDLNRLLDALFSKIERMPSLHRKPWIEAIKNNLTFHEFSFDRLNDTPVNAILLYLLNEENVLKLGLNHFLLLAKAYFRPDSYNISDRLERWKNLSINNNHFRSFNDINSQSKFLAEFGIYVVNADDKVNRINSYDFATRFGSVIFNNIHLIKQNIFNIYKKDILENYHVTGHWAKKASNKRDLLFSILGDKDLDNESKRQFAQGLLDSKMHKRICENYRKAIDNFMKTYSPPPAVTAAAENSSTQSLSLNRDDSDRKREREELSLELEVIKNEPPKKAVKRIFPDYRMVYANRLVHLKRNLPNDQYEIQLLATDGNSFFEGLLEALKRMDNELPDDLRMVAPGILELNLANQSSADELRFSLTSFFSKSAATFSNLQPQLIEFLSQPGNEPDSPEFFTAVETALGIRLVFHVLSADGPAQPFDSRGARIDENSLQPNDVHLFRSSTASATHFDSIFPR